MKTITTKKTALEQLAADIGNIGQEALNGQIDALNTAERLDRQGDEQGRDRALMAALTITRIRRMVESLEEELKETRDESGNRAA